LSIVSLEVIDDVVVAFNTVVLSNASWRNLLLEFCVSPDVCSTIAICGII